QEHNIWIGAKDGLYRLNPKRFVTYTQQHGLSHNNVISVLEDSGGTVWVGTWGGSLNQMKDGKFSTVSKPGVSTELVLSLHEDDKTNIWFGIDFDGGLFRLSNGVLT